MGVVVITMQYGRTTSKLLATVMKAGQGGGGGGGGGGDKVFNSPLQFSEGCLVKTVISLGKLPLADYVTCLSQ